MKSLAFLLLLHMSAAQRVENKHVDIEAEKLSHQEFTTANATEPVAVTVARTTTVEGFSYPVPFPDTVVDLGGAWDESTNELIVPGTSVYLFNLNAGAVPHKPINMNLEGAYNLADLVRGSKAHTGPDTTGRSFITGVLENATVFVSSDADCALYSDGGRQTSLTALDLLGHLDPANPVIFSVARTQPFTDIGPVKFHNDVVNIGGGFDINGTQTVFTPPHDGLYFLTLSGGIKPSMALSATVHVNGTGSARQTLAQLYRNSVVHDGIDTASLSFLVQLNTTNKLWVQLNSGEMHSDGGRQTYLGGFHYNPSRVNPVAWSVYRTNSTTEAEDPLPFDGVRVNQDRPFDMANNVVNITQSGVYYVTLTVGVAPTFPVDVYVVRDRSRAELSIYRQSGYHRGIDTLSQGGLIRLTAGNTLRVVSREGSVVYSDDAIQTVFSGFLIAP